MKTAPEYAKENLCDDHGFHVLAWSQDGPVIALLGKRVTLDATWKWQQIDD